MTLDEVREICADGVTSHEVEMFGRERLCLSPQTRLVTRQTKRSSRHEAGNETCHTAHKLCGYVGRHRLVRSTTSASRRKRAQVGGGESIDGPVDNPESVKVIAVSKPDSVFGRNLHQQRRENGDSHVDDESQRTGHVPDRRASEPRF